MMVKVPVYYDLEKLVRLALMSPKTLEAEFSLEFVEMGNERAYITCDTLDEVKQLVAAKVEMIKGKPTSPPPQEPA